MNNNFVFLDRNKLQKDLRIKLPKQIINNIGVKEGTCFDIYLDINSKDLILRVSSEQETKDNNE